MIDLQYRGMSQQLMDKISGMSYFTVRADNTSAADITITLFDNRSGFSVDASAENIVTNKDDLLQINTEVGMNPILVHFIRLNKRLYDTLTDTQWLKPISVYNQTPMGAIVRKQIKPMNYVSAMYNSNYDDILLYFEEPFMIDMERYLQWDIMAKTQINVIFYYKQLKISNFLFDYLEYQNKKAEDILGINKVAT